MGVTNGWVDPLFRYMHCETLRTFPGDADARSRGGLLGLALLVGCATFAYAAQRGCTRAEILAIRDDGRGEVTGWKG